MKKLIGAAVGLAVFAPGATAASHFLKVTPGKVRAGRAITISGSVDHGCQIGHKGDAATIYSTAFKGITKHDFAGVPAVSVSLGKSTSGAFSFKLKLSKKLKKGTYAVGGRCGGGHFASTTFRVLKPRSTAGGTGYY